MSECTKCGDYLGYDELQNEGTLCDYCTGAADEREKWAEEKAAMERVITAGEAVIVKVAKLYPDSWKEWVYPEIVALGNALDAINTRKGERINVRLPDPSRSERARQSDKVEYNTRKGEDRPILDANGEDTITKEQAARMVRESRKGEGDLGPVNFNDIEPDTINTRKGEARDD